MSALAHRKLEQRLAAVQERDIKIAEAGRTKDAGYLSILPGRPVEYPSPEHPNVHWLAVVHDLRGLGPAGFDGPTLERFAGRASCCAVVPVIADLSIFAGTTLFLDRLLIVETKLPLYAAWQRFLRRLFPDVPFLLGVLEGVRP
jgi:hypothetical protein